MSASLRNANPGMGAMGNGTESVSDFICEERFVDKWDSIQEDLKDVINGPFKKQKNPAESYKWKSRKKYTPSNQPQTDAFYYTTLYKMLNNYDQFLNDLFKDYKIKNKDEYEAEYEPECAGKKEGEKCDKTTSKGEMYQGYPILKVKNNKATKTEIFFQGGKPKSSALEKNRRDKLTEQQRKALCAGNTKIKYIPPYDDKYSAGTGVVIISW